MGELPKIEYDLDRLRGDLIELMTQLSDRRQREIGWIETAYTKVQYQDPVITAEVRETTQKLSSALCVLYFVVVIESYFPNTYIDTDGKQRNLWDEAEQYGWLWSTEIDMLRAYRHVRHSFAHDPEGTHANGGRKAFDRVANSNHRLPLISSDGNKVLVQNGASIHMVNEIHAIVANTLSRMMSSPQYGPKPPQ